jgi:hypothetical protein
MGQPTGGVSSGYGYGMGWTGRGGEQRFQCSWDLYTIGLPNLDSAVPKGSDLGVRSPSVFVN